MMERADFQKCVLTAEVIALLHDIGKYTAAFITGNGNRTELHTILFRDPGSKLCTADLLKILETPVTIPTPDDQNFLRALGDLQCWHHYKEGDLENYFLSDKTKKLPLLLYLMMYADTIDSATSKGGAAFKGETGRHPRLDLSEGNQKNETCHIATPFGEKEFPFFSDKQFDIADAGSRAEMFQQELAAVLKNFPPEALDQLIRTRADLLELMETHLTRGLAETRIPNNDVTLWQHSSSSSSLFKAMLAGHLLNDAYDYCDDRGRLTHYKEKLAIIGFCWSEDELIARSFRATEILGRRKLLDDAAEAVKEYMETNLCLGNEIYRNRDGIYFLVPELTDAVRTNGLLFDFSEKIDNLLNSAEALAGELPWECRYLAIGQQISRLPEVMAGGSEASVIASGPDKPEWTKAWSDTPAKSVCPRCGLRPMEMPLVVIGSEGDDSEKICAQCKKTIEVGALYRKAVNHGDLHFRQRKQRRRLTGMDKGAQFLAYDIEKLLDTREKEEGSRNRLALVQGLVDLRPFISGKAFAAMLAAEPRRFKSKSGEEDKSSEMDSWEKMLAASKTSWAGWQTNSLADEHLHTMQQIFHDKMLGTKGDGRAVGSSGTEKGKNFLRDTVLKAPFPDHLSDEHARLVNYALRKHPAPSRLARFWNNTLNFCCWPMYWCEQNKIPYSTISLDPSRFMILVAARKAEELLQAIHDEYGRRFGRVRHHLALHLSATVFYYKSPLYIGIDAARRFADIGLQRSATPQWWTVANTLQDDEISTITLQTARGRRVNCTYPRKLPNGNPDRFYPWFWDEDNHGHPVHLDDLRQGARVAVYPGSFDYEVLDATTRRYDIRMAGLSRPHSICRPPGPRPYPLETLTSWRQLGNTLNNVEDSQLKNLQELLCRLHQDWVIPGSRDRGETLRAVAEDILRNALGKKLWQADGPEMLDMACDGSLFDLLEWHFYIG